MDEWRNWLPMWAHDSLDLMLVALQVGGIVLVAWLLRRSVGKLFDKIVAHHKVPVDVAVPMKTIGGWVIIVTAGMLVLERLGVSGQVLWTAITGFAAVAAVAFFAAWSVLSNIFCAFLIFSTQPFRVGDELGRADGRPTLIQVPNSAFFQKTIRRWQGGDGEPSI